MIIALPVRTSVPLAPQRQVDRPHGTGASRPAAARLVRRQQNLGPGERRNACVLHQVVVVANQHADPAAVRRIEDRVTIAGRKILAHEDVQFAVAGPAPIRHRDEVAVVELAVVAQLDEPRADRHPVLRRQLQKPPR
jgi:hypothetical protein